MKKILFTLLIFSIFLFTLRNNYYEYMDTTESSDTDPKCEIACESSIKDIDLDISNTPINDDETFSLNFKKYLNCNICLFKKYNKLKDSLDNNNITI